MCSCVDQIGCIRSESVPGGVLANKVIFSLFMCLAHIGQDQFDPGGVLDYVLIVICYSLIGMFIEFK